MSEMSESNILLVLPCELDVEPFPVLTLGRDDLPKTYNGFDCQYFWRPSLKDGSWTNQAKGFTLNVTPDLRGELEKNFRTMSAAGEEVPIVMSHRAHAEEKSEGTLGYVKDIRQRGPWLEELHQYLGPKAAETALKNRLSVGIDPQWSDSRDKFYGNTIIHSAITPIPVVPGQGEAIPVDSATLSREYGDDVIFLSRDTTKNGAPMSELIEMANDDGSGHFIEVDGHPVFIKGPGPGHTAESRAAFHRARAEHHRTRAASAKAEGDHVEEKFHSVMAKGHAAAARGDKAGMTKAAKQLSREDNPNDLRAAEPVVKEKPAVTNFSRSNSMREYKCEDGDSDELHSLVPGLHAVDDDHKLHHVLKHLKTMSTEDEMDAGGPGAVATMSRDDIVLTAARIRKQLREEVPIMRASETELRAQVQELSRQVPATLPPELVDTSLSLLSRDLEQLTKEGRINPACRDALQKSLGKNAAGKTNVLALSRAANIGGDKAFAFQILDDLRQNRPMLLDEQTGLQTLSREVPDENAAGEKAVANVTDRIIARASGK